MNEIYDVAIVGGGPAGSTAGSLLKKYNPDLRVVILERETFPRDHVGESGLPPIGHILNEVGVWDKIEAAGFPIKVGATYKWGKTKELWDFEFVTAGAFEERPRPARFEGQRTMTAFQVDRAIYDDILLQHSAELGCEVRQATRVVEVRREGDRVTGLGLDGGEILEARHYLDASGHSGLLRRTMGVEAEYPTTLQNIAIWDYWQNADWAIEIGVGGTRVQVMSLGYGWIWFIPLGPTRTSVGLIVPAAYYKESGKKPAELYAEALAQEPRISALMRNAVPEEKLATTRDWSFLASRTVGENWFLVGESAGFADPILAAGMTMAHAAGREAAYTILEMDRREHKDEWLREQFDRKQRGRILNHIRFADYWYTANSQFEDLKEFTAELARDSGLHLDPDKAWAWLGQGGFINEDEETGTSGFSIDQLKVLGNYLTDLQPESILNLHNVYRLDLTGATWKERAAYKDGRIERFDSYVRGDRLLPLRGTFGFLVDALQRDSRLPVLVQRINAAAEPYRSDPTTRAQLIHDILQSLEALVRDGWVIPSHDPSIPLIDLTFQTSGGLRWNNDPVPA
ncbi:NAD(P)/FAD-dependent oxidoreductase [bacterium]|nr:MAG: NAD(P)/FAD-dependent oxidoreductase [bacterium]